MKRSAGRLHHLGLNRVFGALAVCTLLTACSQPVASILPRRALAVASLNDKIYITGGWNGEATQLDTVQLFDGRSVVARPALRVARSQHAVVAADGALFAIGGWSAQTGLVREIERLDPHSGTWQRHGVLPTPRREPGVALHGRDIIVAGGFNGTHDGDLDGYADLVEAYDLDSGRWRSLGRLNIGRRGFGLVSAGAELFAIGGYNPGENAHGGFLSIAERYDEQHDRWIPLAWPLAPRTWLAAEAHGDEIIIVGGHDASGPLALVERVNIHTGRVCRAKPLDLPTAWLGVASLRGNMYAIGGETPNGFATTIQAIDATCT